MICVISWKMQYKIEYVQTQERGHPLARAKCTSVSKSKYTRFRPTAARSVDKCWQDQTPMRIFTIWYGTECQFYYHGKLSCSKCFLTKAETYLQANLPFVANSYLMFQTNFFVVTNTIHTISFPPISEEVRACGHSKSTRELVPGMMEDTSMYTLNWSVVV